MKKSRSVRPQEPARKSGVGRLKRRAYLILALGLVSAIGVALFDSEQAGRTFLLVRNLTNVPLTDVEVSGPQGGVAVGKLAVAESKGNQLTRPVDGNYTFHVSYKAGGEVAPEVDLRVLGGKVAFEAIEIHIAPDGVTSMNRTEDEGIPGRVGRFLKGLRGRAGL